MFGWLFSNENNIEKELCVIASVFFLYKTFIRPDSIHTWHFGESRIRAAPIHRLILKESHIMILDGSSMTSMASMQTAVSVPTAMTTLELATPNSVAINFGFIISLCMMKQCFLRYPENNIQMIHIRNNYNITTIPANAFLGAAYLGVSMSSKTTILCMYVCMYVCIYVCMYVCLIFCF